MEATGEREKVESLIVYDVVVIAKCTLRIHVILILVSLLPDNCLGKVSNLG